MDMLKKVSREGSLSEPEACSLPNCWRWPRQ